MLVLTLKKNNYIKVNEGEILVQMLGVSKKGLLLKVLFQNEDDTYSIDDTYISTEEDPAEITDNLKVIHLQGTGRQVKIGLEGSDSVSRCESKFKYTIARPRNLDDDFFNFDTEGY